MPANFRFHSRALSKANEVLRDRALPKAATAVRTGRALPVAQKCAVAGAAALSAAAIAVPTAVAGGGQTTVADAAPAAPVKVSSQPVKDVQTKVTDRLASTGVKVQDIQARQQAAAQQKAAEVQRKAQAAAQQKAAERKAGQSAVNRSAQRLEVRPVADGAKKYANNLDGWIRESLDIMRKHNIPGSYDGIYRNIMRESSGNPKAINNWDINARNGVPSKGLLQVIPPTFKAYHVPGTSWDIYDPVANITAACNYAAHRYGSMDNVNSAY
ncbi:transglycosylase SLT domain-containing protein [Streptomyces thermoviolaceus]|uniref:Transglycosylase SLT domain-containing protein n=1 Tax=Streptomyces thermoviolaceus subsp. thermoviolaceus TaxID=66860 RepID=A0ABX0YTJ8_STRTL|nr:MULTISPECIES: transglycosylase SLT domain-containing protein [Streptomyces]MCM3266268.1 transglycosylase SLT domain-containing protein [Streptomyces thermoviolaceus]NJP14330.1 transglycosylase SLT domain-containing protein [Streptomyces thermoviolaceus subsp. thermoviolaceus]RSS00732.1 lytic transglycosylase [Streptomyces sp. WAC00469]WTD49793.1 transglycosylase SLT domain-containing protein [Streptomyces thermoviolaceus]GGV81522.1 hypothetical protein GCM10010499_46060 [Streptomyces thermo